MIYVTRCKNYDCQNILVKNHQKKSMYDAWHVVREITSEEADGYYEYDYEIQCHKCLYVYVYDNLP